MLISLCFSEDHYPNRLPGFRKQCTSMVCDDDDVMMIQATDPGLPPHAHSLSICPQSDPDKGYTTFLLFNVSHMLISLCFSEDLYPNRLPGFSEQCTSMVCDDDDLMVQDTDPGLPHTLSFRSFFSLTCCFQLTVSRTTNPSCTSALTAAPQQDQETANVKRLDRYTNLCCVLVISLWFVNVNDCGAV
jgi:hypothetical protein